MTTFYAIIRKRSFLLPLVTAWLLATVLDAIAAMAINQVSAQVVFRYIAAGIFGTTKAFGGSTSMIIYGLMLHAGFALCWTVLYFVVIAPRNFRWLRNIFTAALFYGSFVWLVMNFVVIPLSKLPQPAPDWKDILTGIGVISTAVALPIVFFAQKNK